jgi:hypothetical protein
VGTTASRIARTRAEDGTFNDPIVTKAVFRPAPRISVFKAWSLERQRRALACRRGVDGSQVDGVGVLQTDAQGKGQTPPRAAGTYY